MPTTLKNSPVIPAPPTALTEVLIQTIAGLIVLTRNESDFARIAQHDSRLRFAQEPS